MDATPVEVPIPLVDGAMESQQICSDAARAMILAIDDEWDIRMAIARQLRVLGFRPVLASNGTDGLRLFDEHAPDIQLVLLDWNMPGKSGKEVLAELLNRRPDLRVVLVTASTDAMTDEHASRDTVSILRKPFAPAQLALVVGTVLGVRPRG